ncbi:hypothetical protein [Curtobacterium oceanosedimentum]|uniref:Uncharacterized protein n=1 Tax=Curtobacterium oceanosedimentum TaxID=465820 RepID=A0A147DRG4_9MICO|nr:hypothetical protein [Curtobacterium oceanosedimentum]KTR52265.1 hypothetical protein NS359_06910 [Curtobacterium oceanosedimentum]
MFVEPSRSAQPQPAPTTPVVGLLTPPPAEPDIEPGADHHSEPEPPRNGVVRHGRTTATSTFRMRNGAEVPLAGALGAYSGMYPRGYLRRLRSAPTT